MEMLHNIDDAQIRELSPDHISLFQGVFEGLAQVHHRGRGTALMLYHPNCRYHQMGL
jgi:hypothetical protein